MGEGACDERSPGFSPPSPSRLHPGVACAAPSASMYLDPRGEVRACCQNEWMRLGNVAEQPLVDIWRGPTAQRLREAVGSGDLSLGCARCALAAETGGPEVTYARVFDRVGPVRSSPPWPRQLEMALSNACNLECVMCNGELSSAIRLHREGRAPLPPVYGESFFAELDEFLPHLESIGFLGGEPLLAPETLRVMERLIELGLSPQCTLTTNGTQWSRRVERVLSLLPVHVTVSIDGMSAGVLESVRVGARRDRLFENVDRYRATVARSGGNLSVAFCLMRATGTEMGALLEWADGRDLDVYVNEVSHPSALSLVHAPRTELVALLDALTAEDGWRRDRLGRNRDVWDRQLDGIRSLIDARQPRPAGTPVRIGRPPPAAAAVISVGDDQLVRSVEVGGSDRFGLDLGRLVGASIWELVDEVTGSLGDLLSATVESADETERWVFAFAGSQRSVLVTAVMQPAVAGGQQWQLEVDEVDGDAAVPGLVPYATDVTVTA